LPDEAAPEASAPAPGEPPDLAGEPMAAQAAEATIGVPEAPALAASEQAEGVAGIADLLAAPRPTDAASKSDLTAPELIDVWRPGRRDEHARRPRPERGSRQPRAPRQAAQTPPVAISSGETAALGADDAIKPAADAAAAPPAAPRQARRQRHAPPDRGDRPERQPRPDGSPRHPRNERFDRPQRGDRPPHGERSERGSRGERPDRDPALRAKYIKGRGDGRDLRDREPDPNSPFAKLAALKEQLEANTKEPR
jgi:ATP-dependent RNA helicase SUPV3L1/SUV3